MILLAHLIFGAAIGSFIRNIYVAIILAYISHYILDLIPHLDYPLKNIERKQWKNSAYDFLKIGFDLLTGFLLIYVFSKNQLIIYLCGIIALIPDGLTLIYLIMPNKILSEHRRFHEKIHFLKDKKIPSIWRIFSQVIIVLISIIILFFLR